MDDNAQIELKSDDLLNEFRYDEMQAECKEFILATACSVIIRNDTGEIIYITPEAEKSFGYVWNELVGQKLEILIPPHIRAHHVGYREAQGVVAEGRQMAFGREVNAQLKDGSQRRVYIRLTSKYAIDKRTSKKTLLTKADLIFTPGDEGR